MDHTTLSLITIPLFTGAIGYVTNLSGVWMLFYPVRFAGVRVPGLAPLANVLPRRIQQIPGLGQGGLGWQGIVPSRAAKMGSIAVDKGLSKVGSPGEFYRQLDPEAIAEQILEKARGEIYDVVERIMERERPQLWHDLPPRVRAAVHARVEEQLPQIVRTITDEIGTHADDLIDVKLMVIRRLEANPALANRIFLEVGRKELRFIVNFGFFFGLLLGVPTAFLTEYVLTPWWVLPIAGVLIGYTTNLLGIRMIFEPVRPRQVGPFELQGLFLKRQPEVAGVYADIIADDVVTMTNIAEDLMHGPNSDRTRQLIEDSLRPAIGRALGRARSAVRVAVRQPRLRDDPHLARRRGGRLRGCPTGRRGVQRQAERWRARVRSHAGAGDGPARILGDAAHGDARGRVAALSARGCARIRCRVATPGDLRMTLDDDRGDPREVPRRTSGPTGQEALEELLQAAPGLARIAANMAWQGASEIANAYVEGASRVVRAASQGESTADAVQETTAELRAYLRELIGVEEGSRSRPTADASAEALRSRGEELLRRSADVSADVDSHPAYMRILDALAPDEARILRFLAREGEQPSVDVRAGLPFASELVAQGCTMIAEEAGCRHADRVYAYLNNLNRLGLVWFSRESLRDARRYQVLEAQTEVTEALERGGRTARTVRRSIVLTPFGEDFCAICLPLE